MLLLKGTSYILKVTSCDMQSVKLLPGDCKVLGFIFSLLKNIPYHRLHHITLMCVQVELSE